MDEKDLVRRAKNSIKAGKSNAEILNGFQKRGYKLEYADAILKKAKRPKKIILGVSSFLFLFLALSAIIALGFSNNEKFSVTNPLSGYTVSSRSSVEQIESLSEEVESKRKSNTEKIGNIFYEDIEINEELITYILSEIGASSLHKNPLTRENAIINFKIGDDEFYSEISEGIKTYRGLSNSADLIFYIDKKDFVDSILAQDSSLVFVESLGSGRSRAELLVGEVELFSKGYLELYESLSL